MGGGEVGGYEGRLRERTAQGGRKRSMRALGVSVSRQNYTNCATGEGRICCGVGGGGELILTLSIWYRVTTIQSLLSVTQLLWRRKSLVTHHPNPFHNSCWGDRKEEETSSGTPCKPLV